MSKYSGKCDLYDSIMIYAGDKDVEEILPKVSIYLGESIIPLRIDTYKDLIPYFPFVPYICGSDPSGMMLRLPSMSFVDQTEQERVKYAKERVMKDYNRCKRAHTDFIPKNYYIDGEIEYVIANDLAAHGKKYIDEKEYRNIDHFLTDFYRKELDVDMINAGWEEPRAFQWVYGWRALFDRDIAHTSANNG